MKSDHGFRSSSSLTQAQKSQGAGIQMFINADDQIATIGECQIDKRSFEAYCIQCNILVCPNCAMFGIHKGHNFCTLEEASKILRGLMDDAAKNGQIILINATENVLVDVRHTRLTCEESKQRVLKEVEQTFQSIFKLIKQRKEEVYGEITKHFDTQFNVISDQEKIWVDKQERALELIKMAKAPNDIILLEKAPFIVESLQLLQQKSVYNNLHLVNSIDTNFKASTGNTPQVQISLNLNEYKKALEKWIALGDPVLIQFKC